MSLHNFGTCQEIKTIIVETILYSSLNYKTTILCTYSSQHIKFLAPLPGIDYLFLTISILNKLGFNLEFLFYFFNFFFSFLLQVYSDIAKAREWSQSYEDYHEYQGYQDYHEYQGYQGNNFRPFPQQRMFQQAMI